MRGASPAWPCLPSAPDLWDTSRGKEQFSFPGPGYPGRVETRNREHFKCIWRALSSRAFRPSFENPHNVPLAELPLLSQLHRKVKVLPRTPPSQSPTNFCPCSLNPATLAVLPLFSSACFFLIPLCHFLWVHQKGGEIFLSLVCFTPLLPSVHPGS